MKAVIPKKGTGVPNCRARRTQLMALSISTSWHEEALYATPYSGHYFYNLSLQKERKRQKHKMGQKPISIPKLFLHIEGLGILIAAVGLYIYLHASGWLFLLLLLAPDLGMLGYLANSRIGAVIYNIAHLETIPLMLLFISFLSGWAGIIPFALIWLAHIGMDRAVGYGLKYPALFQDTHLSHV